MRVVVHITNGPFAGRKIELTPGQVIAFGRTEWSDYAIPHDLEISGQHFSLQCSPHHCQLRDLDSSNGTFVNGEQVSVVVLRNRDTIRAGQTQFDVRLEGLLPTPVEATDGIDTAESGDSVNPALRAVPAAKLHSPAVSVPQPFQEALEGEDPELREAALLAAACSRQSWLLVYCGTRPLEDWWALYLLAVLGAPADLDHIRALTSSEEQAPTRFQLLGASGHPEVMQELLDAISGPDPVAAQAAGAAFTKITGAEIDAEGDSEPATDLSDEQEAGDDAPEPVTADCDPELARQHWHSIQGQYVPGTRWCGGVDVSQDLPDSVLDQLDLESRWEVCLRGIFSGTWPGRLIDLELFSA